jgi:hypothetical protein
VPSSLKRRLASLAKNTGQVALEMGNSAGIVLKHYHEIVEAKAACEYWSIKPVPWTDGKIIKTA